jgi:hypothetical protein
VRWAFARFYACAVGSACAFNRQMYLVDRSAEQWINARSFFGALWCISSPRLCGAQRGPVEGGTTGDGPVRALRRLPQGLGPRSQEWPPWARGFDRGAIGASTCLARWVDAWRGCVGLCAVHAMHVRGCAFRSSADSWQPMGASSVTIANGEPKAGRAQARRAEPLQEGPPEGVR